MSISTERRCKASRREKTSQPICTARPRLTKGSSTGPSTGQCGPHRSSKHEPPGHNCPAATTNTDAIFHPHSSTPGSPTPNTTPHSSPCSPQTAACTSSKHCPPRPDARLFGAFVGRTGCIPHDVVLADRHPRSTASCGPPPPTPPLRRAPRGCGAPAGCPWA